MPIKLPKLPSFTIPTSLGACADLIYTLRCDRLLVQKIVEELQTRESRVRDVMIDTLPLSQSTGVAGMVARVTIVTKQIPRAVDWGQIFSYIKENEAFDLVQRRLSDGAVNERWEQDIIIPGIEKFGTKILSVNKV